MATSTPSIESRSKLKSSVIDVPQASVPPRRSTLRPVRSTVSRGLLGLCAALDLIAVFAIGLSVATALAYFSSGAQAFSVKIWGGYIPLLLVQSVLCVSFAALRREYESWPSGRFLNRVRFASTPSALSALTLIPLLAQGRDPRIMAGIFAAACLDVPTLMLSRLAMGHVLHAVL